MTMDLRFALDNYRVLRAAWTAMDQTYGVVQTGQVLGAIDNTGQGRLQPFATPEGFLVADVVTDPTTSFKAVIYQNAATNEVIVSFMGTNGWEDTKGWNVNLTSLAREQWDAKQIDPVTGLPGKTNGELVFEAL